MDAGDLFIQTLEHLHRALAATDEYHLLRASHLIRQLVLDSSSLSHAANRPHRVVIEYPISVVTPPAGSGPRCRSALGRLAAVARREWALHRDSFVTTALVLVAFAGLMLAVMAFGRLGSPPPLAGGPAKVEAFARGGTVADVVRWYGSPAGQYLRDGGATLALLYRTPEPVPVGSPGHYEFLFADGVCVRVFP